MGENRELRFFYDVKKKELQKDSLGECLQTDWPA